LYQSNQKFGAAAAAGRLLKLNQGQMVYAFAIAGTQASGLREVFGSMCQPFHAGKAAQNGTLAALLAQRGFTGTDGIFEGARGLVGVMERSRHRRGDERFRKALGVAAKRTGNLLPAVRPIMGLSTPRSRVSRLIPLLLK
jgi:2-methylcitrate dehydratase PrpD